MSYFIILHCPILQFKALQAQLQDGGSSGGSSGGGHPHVSHLALVGDDLLRWRFGLRNFDADLPGGRQLNEDLARLAREHGQDHLLMEVGV